MSRADRISLVNFMFSLADDISPAMRDLDPDTQHYIDQTMTAALCAAHDGDGVKVKLLAAQVRWRLGQQRCCDGC